LRTCRNNPGSAPASGRARTVPTVRISWAGLH
jgi:hypothetical protein